MNFINYIYGMAIIAGSKLSVPGDILLAATGFLCIEDVTAAYHRI